MKEGDRVVVKGHHRLRGTLIHVQAPGCDVRFDDFENGDTAIYLLEELEPLRDDCPCHRCVDHRKEKHANDKG